MSEEEEPFYVTMKVKEMPISPIPSVKLVCSGGCGDEVWVDKNTERIWSEVPVLCLDCAMKAMQSEIEEVKFALAPESIDSLMTFLLREIKSSNL